MLSLFRSFCFARLCSNFFLSTCLYNVWNHNFKLNWWKWISSLFQNTLAYIKFGNVTEFSCRTNGERVTQRETWRKFKHTHTHFVRRVYSCLTFQLLQFLMYSMTLCNWLNCKFLLSWNKSNTQTEATHTHIHVERNRKEKAWQCILKGSQWAYKKKHTHTTYIPKAWALSLVLSIGFWFARTEPNRQKEKNVRNLKPHACRTAEWAELCVCASLERENTGRIDKLFLPLSWRALLRYFIQC